MASDDDDETLVKFLESEVFFESSDQEEETGDASRNLVEDDYEDDMRKEEEENEEAEEKEVNKMLIEEGCISCEDENNGEGNERLVKRRRVEEVENKRPFTLTAGNMLPSVELEAAFSSKKDETALVKGSDASSSVTEPKPKIITPGSLGKVPPELFRSILRFLSSEDLVSCSLACRFLNNAASDESLWRRLYSLRWGPIPPTMLRETAWKKHYIQRDKQMVELASGCPPEFVEYYKQMHTAKRSQAPLPSQVIDDLDLVGVDDTITGQKVSTWKRSRGMTKNVVANHACSGVTCTYTLIDDAFICEKTGNVHVCGEHCKEVVADSGNQMMVCTISGRCFEELLSPRYEMIESEDNQQGAIEEEVCMGGAGQAFQFGYECDDEEELEATWRFC